MNTLQLTPDVTKKTNTRLVSAIMETTVTMIEELLREIIYSQFPLVISPIFAHLKTDKPGNQTIGKWLKKTSYQKPREN